MGVLSASHSRTYAHGAEVRVPGCLLRNTFFFLYILFCVTAAVIAAVVRAVGSCSIVILQHCIGGSSYRKESL